jgi:CRISPR-associated protein Csm1
MARVAGGKAQGDPSWSDAFVKLLNPTPAVGTAKGPLRCIFDLVRGGKEGGAPMWVRPVPLALGNDGDPATWALMPIDAPPDAATRQALYAQFERHSKEAGQDYERFFHLMRKFATTLPNAYGEPGVSLFEQWKMVAALVEISDGTDKTPERLGLVGGDIPGIQRTINTITSKGAAKAMRGRSAFIQLLGHALVEKLLDELNLGSANVVYDAGGNFVLLTGWTDDLPNRVQEVANQVNLVLLAGTANGSFDGFHGDLAVAVAAVGIPVSALAMPAADADASPWQQAEKQVKDAVAAAKHRPFGDLALGSDEGWKALFGPDPAETAEFCAVCRRPKGKGEWFESLTGEAEGQICPECKGFNDLADDLGHRAARLTLSVQSPARPQAWQSALHAVSDRWYFIGKAGERGDIVLALDLDDFPAARADGFRLLAHTTPMNGDRIKTNEELAGASRGGLKRLGVLRMDVDNLSDLIVHGLPARTAMQTAELSQALERFFAGWLDRICRATSAHDDEGDLFYVLFAGGDDLFVVGPWTHMPKLAQAIRDDFAAYTGGHPDIHLSAGIAVVGEKAPLYAAADESHDALSEAKKLDRGTDNEKNAITFLGQSLHWEQFEEAAKLKKDIVTLAEDDGLGNAVITRLLAIARRYQQDLANDLRIEEDEQFKKTPRGRRRGAWGVLKPKHGPEVQAYYGPWMWRQAYALKRLGEGRSTEVIARLRKLETALLEGQIAHLGLAARWAQWLTRKGEEHGDQNQ